MHFTLLKFNTMISNANGVDSLRVCTPKIGLDNATLVLTIFYKSLKFPTRAQVEDWPLSEFQISTCSILTLALTLTLN